MPAQAELRPAAAHQCTDRRDRGAFAPSSGDASELSGPTVTVAALSAVSAALAGHLRALGDDPSALGAEVPMAKPPPRLAYNHFGNVGVGLYPDLTGAARSPAIADDLDGASAARRAPGDAGGRPGLRRDARAVVALGDGAIRSRRAARRR